MAELVMVADDDPDILRFVQLNLEMEGYEVVTAVDGEDALRVARERKPALVILDVMMPKLDGFEVCQRLRSDPQLGDVSIVMLTAKSMSADKVLGLTAGADDYIGKPFDPNELLARVRNTLRRAQEMRSLSPLTALPGNVRIDSELRRRIEAGQTFALLWLDLDHFKGYNDHYGFSRGDAAIEYLATVLREVTADDPEAFIGHIGGDDFVAICNAGDAEALARSIIERFDAGVRSLYDSGDAEHGWITVTDRRGEQQRYPLLSVSIGAATTEHRTITDHRELVELATEMKTFAKEKAGSVYEVDRRAEPL